MDSSAATVISDFVLDDIYADEIEHEDHERNIAVASKMGSRKYSVFHQNGLSGVFNEKYEVLIQPVWSDIQYLDDDIFACYLDDEHYVIWNLSHKNAQAISNCMPN